MVYKHLGKNRREARERDQKEADGRLVYSGVTREGMISNDISNGLWRSLLREALKKGHVA